MDGLPDMDLLRKNILTLEDMAENNANESTAKSDDSSDDTEE